jgi:hypothetical protein
LQERRRLEIGLGVVAVRRPGGRQEGHRQVGAIISVNKVVEAQLAAHDQPGYQRGGNTDGQADNGQERSQAVDQQVAPGRDEDVRQHQRCPGSAEPAHLPIHDMDSSQFGGLADEQASTIPRAAKEEILDRPLSEQVESERNQGLEQQH